MCELDLQYFRDFDLVCACLKRSSAKNVAKTLKENTLVDSAMPGASRKR